MITLNHISRVGSKHALYVKARLFSGEEKRGSALDETTPAANSLDTSRDKECQDPKLNTHHLSERSETSISLLQGRLSEDNQIELTKGYDSEVSMNGVCPNSESGEPQNEYFVSSMLIGLNEFEREKRLLKNILSF
jgi:hypothetical protein